MTLDASAITVGSVHSAVVVENLTRTPVSYTHLDVYKRQPMGFSMPGIPCRASRMYQPSLVLLR